MNKLNAVISIVALVVLTSCSKKDAGTTNSSQATMNVQEAKSVVKESPYKGEIERGLTLQFDYVNISHGKIETLKNVRGNYVVINGTTINNGDSLQADVFENFTKFLFALQKDGLVTIEQVPDKMPNDERSWKGIYEHNFYNVECTPKALGLRDEKYSDTNYLRIPLGVCKVQTIVKDVEYNMSGPAEGNNFRLVMGTYEVKPNDFGKSQGVVDYVFKFRAVIKLNPFNQTYSYVAGDYGKTDADDWQTQNVPQ